MPQLNWDDVRHAMAVGEAGSLAGAARALGVSWDAIRHGLGSFLGVGRRFGAVALIDDQQIAGLASFGERSAGLLDGFPAGDLDEQLLVEFDVFHGTTRRGFLSRAGLVAGVVATTDRRLFLKRLAAAFNVPAKGTASGKTVIERRKRSVAAASMASAVPPSTTTTP